MTTHVWAPRARGRIRVFIGLAALAAMIACGAQASDEIGEARGSAQARDAGHDVGGDVRDDTSPTRGDAAPSLVGPPPQGPTRPCPPACPPRPPRPR